MAITKAILLVGGEGTRLRPLTLATPKPMLPLAGYPITAHQIAKLAAAGITEVMLATSYRTEVFADWLAQQDYLDLQIQFAIEEVPLGTGGAIRNAADHLNLTDGESVVVLNGDVLSGHNLKQQLIEYESANAGASLHLVSVTDPSSFGLVPTNDSGEVLAFLEKPATAAEIVTNQINAGCYILHFDVINQISQGVPSSVERDVFPALLKTQAKVIGYLDNTYFLDLGTPHAYVQGSADLVTGKVSSPLISNAAQAVIHPTAKVDPTAMVFGGSVVMAQAEISAGAVVSGSIIFANAKIAMNSQLFDSILGSNSKINSDLILNKIVVAENCTINAEIPPGVRVWPDLEINAN
jgi:mannose-1-phosphate guanylyltransferase